MGSSCFADRLGEWMMLTAAERAALGRLEERERRLRRGAVLVRHQDRLGDLFVLREGTMMSYVVTETGSRQILRFLFPGDLLSISSLICRTAPDTIAALSDCVVAPFDRGVLTEIVEAHPRLGIALVAIGQVERLICTDRLAAIGRTPARARIAALLLELRDRMRAACHPDAAMPPARFAPGVTQEEIGDATGLTAVHVNRMLRELENEGVIARHNGQFTLLDETALARIAHYADRFAGLDLGWLPPAAS